MKYEGIIISGLIIIVLFILAVSGFTSTDNSTKHYDNGNISFDYPADMYVQRKCR